MSMVHVEDELIEAIGAIGLNAAKIANAITPLATPGSNDATSGYVASLTEAVMGTTAALVSISDSIRYLADSITDAEMMHLGKDGD